MPEGNSNLGLNVFVFLNFIYNIHNSSSSDTRFLQQHPGSNEESVFGWYLTLKDRVVLDECKFKINANNIEIKLKKQTKKKWGSPTTVAPETGELKCYNFIY